MLSFTTATPSAPISSTQQQEGGFAQVLPSLLSGAFNTGLGIFEKWVDHELGLSEVALSAEGQAHTQAIAQQEAPAGAFQIGTQQFTLTTLLLVGGIGLVVLLLLRS